MQLKDQTGKSYTAVGCSEKKTPKFNERWDSKKIKVDGKPVTVRFNPKSRGSIAYIEINGKTWYVSGGLDNVETATIEMKAAKTKPLPKPAKTPVTAPVAKPVAAAKPAKAPATKTVVPAKPAGFPKPGKKLADSKKSATVAAE